MSKVYLQNAKVVWESTATMTADELASGSAYSEGYAKLIGGFYSNASTNACMLKIQQSYNDGTNWDWADSYQVTASAACAFEVAIYGNAVKVSCSNGATAASLVRAYFALRPI